MFKLVRQLLLPVCDPLAYIQGLAQARKASKVNRPQRKAIRDLRNKLAELSSESQLELFSVVTDAVEGDSEEDLAKFLEELVNMSDKEMVAFADWFVKRNIVILSKSTSDKVRREIVTWCNPASDPNEVFSMAFWCRIAGWNPEHVSRHVLKHFRKDILRWIGEDEGKAPASTHRAAARAAA